MGNYSKPPNHIRKLNSDVSLGICWGLTRGQRESTGAPPMIYVFSTGLRVLDF